jgi:hypothetical protein
MVQKGFVLVFLSMVSACAEAPQPAWSESNCELPQAARLNADHSRRGPHLIQEAELAEDAAIRYADACCGPHSGHFQDMSAYGQKRDECMAKLFRIVARDNGVTEDEVRRSLTIRPMGFDLAVIVFCGVLYTMAAYMIVARLWSRYLGGGERFALAIMMIYASAIVSAAGVLLAELWFLAFESARIGSGHLSDRTGRIPVIHHRPAIFVAGLLVFWLVAGLRYIAELRSDISSRRT